MNGIEEVSVYVNGEVFKINQLNVGSYNENCSNSNSHTDDSTGLRIYHGSQVLLRFLSNSQFDENFICKSIIELGGGTGVVGLVSFRNKQIKKLVCSDGNPLACEICHTNIASILKNHPNRDKFSSTQYMWSSCESENMAFLQNNNEGEPFDVVLGSELLYYRTDIQKLVHSVLQLTQYNGLFIHSHVFRNCQLENEMKEIFTQNQWKTLYIPVNTFVSEEELSTQPTWYQVCTLISGPVDRIDQILLSHPLWKIFESYNDACDFQCPGEDSDGSNNILYR